MGLFDGLIKKFAEVSWKKNGEKWIKGAAVGIVAAGSPLIAKHLGLELTPEQNAALAVAITSALLGVANMLKHAFPQQLSWL